MNRSHSRHTYPLEKTPDRSVLQAIRTQYKIRPGEVLKVTLEANTRACSRAWQSIKRLQSKKRRMSTVDQFGVSFAEAAQERFEVPA